MKLEFLKLFTGGVIQPVEASHDTPVPTQSVGLGNILNGSEITVSGVAVPVISNASGITTSLLIRNVGANAVCLTNNSVPTFVNGILLYASEAWECSPNAIPYAICSGTTSTTLRVTEHR